MNFDADGEIRNRLERGQSYGLTKPQYGALAHIAMGAFRMAGVEPAEIRLLAGEPGCDVILYGKNFVFTIRMQPARQCSTLYALPLDSKLGGPGVELYSHEFRSVDYVGAILTHILAHEGVPLMSWEDVEEWHRRHNGVDY